MQFTMTHHFGCSSDKLWELFDNPEFERRLEEETGVRREVVEEDRREGLEYKKIRCISLREIPKVMQKALGTEQFEFTQENRLRREQGLLEWSVSTPFLTDRVDAGGTTRVEEGDSGCQRTVEGEINIRLPLVGKKMENKLSENIQESYEKAAVIARDLLQQG